MISVKTIRPRYFRILNLLITVALSVSAGNELKVVQSSSSLLDILHADYEEVTGIQFCFYTSSRIILQSVKPSTRTMESSWIVDSNTANDLIIDVFILNVKQQRLPNGSRALASIHFTKIDTQEMNSVVLTNIIIIDGKSDIGKYG